MNLLSQKKFGKKDTNNTYIKLIIYESHLLTNSKLTNNIFPYSISIQFNNSSEKIIPSIKNANEIFNISSTKFKYLINKSDKNVSLKINCFTKNSSKLKKNFASCVIKLENKRNIKKLNNGSSLKKWYFLKNKDNKKILKLLLSINYYSLETISTHFYEKENKNQIYTESEQDNNIIINNPDCINMHINSITNNNLNIITNNIYMTNLNISSLDELLIEKINNNTIDKKRYKSKNFFTNILIKNKEQNENYLLQNNFYSIIDNTLEKINPQFTKKSNYLTNKIENCENQNNIYNKDKYIFEEKNKFLNKEKTIDKEKIIYKNKNPDLNIYDNEFKFNLYRDEILNEINTYEKDVLSNINNMILNNLKLKEINLEKTIHNIYLFKKNSSFCSNIYSENNKIISDIIEKDNDINIGNYTPSLFKQNKKHGIINFLESKSNSPYSEKFAKEHFTTDYSRSTFNVENELFMIDNETPEKNKKEFKKGILNIEQIINNKNKKNKFTKDKTNYNKMNNKKYNTSSNLNRKKKKNIIINKENEFNIYYNLENKKKEDIYSFNIFNSNMNNNNLKKSAFNQKLTKNNSKKMNNQVFKNVFNPKNNIITNSKFVKKEKINSNMTFNTDNTTFNNTIIGINSIIPQKIKNLENKTSRNSNIIGYKRSKKKFQTIDKNKINLNSKKLRNNKTKLFGNINNKINKKTNNKEFNKKDVVYKKIDNNKNHFSKIFKTHCVTKNNFFQNKIIKKKSYKILNNSKKHTNLLTNKKSLYESDYKTNYNKLFFYKKMKTFNPLECQNLEKKKKNNRQVIITDNIIGNNDSNINNKKLKLK